MYKIPSFKSYYSKSDVDAMMTVIERSMFWADGPEIEILEENIAKYLGLTKALAFNSGTSALYTLLLSIDVRDKEVICPSFTFVATANAIVLAGGIPIFADSEPETFGLNADDVERKITKNTKAVITIDYGGCLCRDIERLNLITKKYELFFIEDAAQSFGATAHERHAGFHSDAAIFSFCQNKIITALGEGGAIVTNNMSLFEKAKCLRSHGRVDSKHKHFETSVDNEYAFPGFNFRMPTTSAAFLNSQLSNIYENVKQRKDHASLYGALLSDLSEFVQIPRVPSAFNHCYQMYTIRLNKPEHRDGLMKFLLENGVLVRCYFELVHLKSYYKIRHETLELPIAKALSQTVLTLPLFPQMSKDEIKYVVNLIKKYFYQ